MCFIVDKILNMEVIQRPGGKLPTCSFETANKSVIYCLMNPENLRPESEVITIEDEDDVTIIENRKGLLKMKELFPCAVSTGCRKSPNAGEPEHILRCLIVKILKEFKTPNIYIEQLCTILSKRYKYYYSIPPYTLVRMIKDAINKTEDFLKTYKIMLNEKQHCILLPNEDEVIDLDSEDEDDVNREIKLEYEAKVKKEVSESFMKVSVGSMVTGLDDELVFLGDDARTEPMEVKHSVSMATQTDDDSISIEEDLMDEDEALLVIDENPPFLTPPRSDACEVQRAKVIYSTSTQVQTTADVYSLHEERELRNWMASSLYSPSLSSKSEEQGSGISTKTPVERIGLAGVLKCLEELKLTTFAVFDIRNYYESRFDIGHKVRMYSRIYMVLRNNPTHFRKTNDKKWELVSSKTSSLPKEKPRSPAPLLKRRKFENHSPIRDHLENTQSEDSLENLIRTCLNSNRTSYQIPVSYSLNSEFPTLENVSQSFFDSNRPSPGDFIARTTASESTICYKYKPQNSQSRSILVVFARIMRSKQMPRWQLLNEILFLLPHVKSADSSFELAVDHYLQMFCFKISTPTSTEWSLPEAKYKEICNYLYKK